jgi:hypothetical protein
MSVKPISLKKIKCKEEISRNAGVSSMRFTVFLAAGSPHAITFIRFEYWQHFPSYEIQMVQ